MVHAGVAQDLAKGREGKRPMCFLINQVKEVQVAWCTCIFRKELAVD